MIDALKDLWGIIGALVALGVWLVRMEGRVNRNTEEILRLERRLDSDRADTKAALADLTDVMRETQRDVKTLLGRGRVVHWDEKTQPPR